jgi:hypothetical protein
MINPGIGTAKPLRAHGGYGKPELLKWMGGGNQRGKNQVDMFHLIFIK